MSKTVMLIPVDPVHDIALKMISRALIERGHKVVLLPPDLPPEEIIEQALALPELDTILISRTLGYGVGEILGRLMDMADAAGLRERVRIALGGMAIRKELAAELGFDRGFGPDSTIEEAVAYVEGLPYVAGNVYQGKVAQDFTAGYDYSYGHERIGKKLKQIAEQVLQWTAGKTSPGVIRADLRDSMWSVEAFRAKQAQPAFTKEYSKHCTDVIEDYYIAGKLHPKTRLLTAQEVAEFTAWVAEVRKRQNGKAIRHTRPKPVVFNQYGTGCPFMDLGQAIASEAWGADGVVHFDPSWGARSEGFLDGLLTHQEDGTVITPENLELIRQGLEPGTLWQVRAHRGLNTPETVVLAGKLGANLTKINICYGALGAGTDPERLTVDALAAMRYAAKYNLPFDVVTNEELCGVPAYKAFAGMLIVAELGRQLGGKPILQPLFAYSPEAMITKCMEDNYVDFNAAKIKALRSIINAPIWAGAPIGFLTQTEDRVQSSMSTALHAALAASLELDAISIASADEAYSGGPITTPSKIDTLRATHEAFRFLGHASITPTAHSEVMAQTMVQQIEEVLDQVLATGDFVAAMYKGILGNREDGAYPGRAGRDTVVSGAK